MMDEKATMLALRVMNKIMNREIAKPYLFPVDPANPPEGYFERIKNPQDLTDIKLRLQTKKYIKIQDWFSDVELVWSNAELFYGSDSINGKIATECRRLFNKYKLEADILDIKRWCIEVYKLKNKISQYKSSPPEKIRKIATYLGNFNDSLAKQGEPFLPKDLPNFMKAYRILKPESNKEMAQVLKEFEKDIELNTEENWVDLTKLNLGTIDALRDFMKERLKEEGRDYPQ